MYIAVKICYSFTAQSIVTMAKSLTPSVTPASGYWTTENYDGAVNFIINYLEEKIY